MPRGGRHASAAHSACRGRGPEIADLIHAEARRQYEKIRLIPSENYVSPAVLEASGRCSPTSTRRATRVVATTRASSSSTRSRRWPRTGRGAVRRGPRQRPAVLGVARQPRGLPGVPEPGDTVMGMALPMGGHLTHGWDVSVTGKWFRPVQYGVRPDTGRVDLDEVRDLALGSGQRSYTAAARQSPGASTSRGLPPSLTRSARSWSLTSRTSPGLIAGGAHPSPAGHAPVISTTTHKTLRGPRARCSCPRPNTRRRWTRPSSPGSRAARTTTRRPRSPSRCRGRRACFGGYAHQVVANAKALAEGLLDGLRAGSGGTDNHLILIDLTPKGIPGKPAAKALDRAGINELQHRAVRPTQAV